MANKYAKVDDEVKASAHLNSDMFWHLQLYDGTG